MSIAKIDTGRYIAIGIWQWGKHLPANDGWTSSQVNFPIAFNSACLAVNLCIVLGDDKNDFESSVDHSPGLTSFSLYYSARRTRPIFWIAIGYWQWGNTTGNASNARNTTTFPITFLSACFAVCVTQKVNATGSQYVGASRVMSISKTDFIWGTNSGSSYWFTVGYSNFAHLKPL